MASVTGLHSATSPPPLDAEDSAAPNLAGEALRWEDGESTRCARPAGMPSVTSRPTRCGAYLKQIGKVALLNAEQEVELAKRIEAGLYAAERLCKLARGNPDNSEDRIGVCSVWPRRDLNWIIRDGQRAKNHLLEANLRLVASMAKRYTGRGLGFLDLRKAIWV
jgi:RNA polymerase primary sigma factor